MLPAIPLQLKVISRLAGRGASGVGLAGRLQDDRLIIQIRFIGRAIVAIRRRRGAAFGQAVAFPVVPDIIRFAIKYA